MAKDSASSSAYNSPWSFPITVLNIRVCLMELKARTVSSSIFNDIRLEIKIELNFERQSCVEDKEDRAENCPPPPLASDQRQSTQSEPNHGTSVVQTFGLQSTVAGGSLLGAQTMAPSLKPQATNMSNSNVVHSGSEPPSEVAASRQTPNTAEQPSTQCHVCLPFKSTHRIARRYTTGSTPLTSTTTHLDCSFKPFERDEGNAKETTQLQAGTPSVSPEETCTEKSETNTVPMGNIIDEAHVHYGLVNNMLEGIRISLSRCQPKMVLTNQDYTVTHVFSKHRVKHKDYAPQVCCELCDECFDLDLSQFQLFLTEKRTLWEFSSADRSGSFCCFSQDHRFILKTIRHSEHICLLKIMKQYHEHVKKYPGTLLPRLYGLHRVKLPGGRNIYFVVLKNLFPLRTAIHGIYHLSGGRYPEESAKERDVNCADRSKVLGLDPVNGKRLMEQLRKDLEFLRDVNLMNYSLLVGIHNRHNTATRKPDRNTDEYQKLYGEDDGVSGLPDDEANQVVYYLGIVDILTPHSRLKQLKHFWKSLRGGRRDIVTASRPTEYMDRFLKFMEAIIYSAEDVGRAEHDRG